MGKHSAPDEQCKVCGLRDGNHDMRKHRLALNDPLEKSISRHPAGKRRAPKVHGDA